MARDDHGRRDWNDRGSQGRDPYEGGEQGGRDRFEADRSGREGSGRYPRGDERDLGYDSMGRDGEGRDERLDYSGRGGVGGGMGREGGGRYAGRPEDDARPMRYDRADYEGGASQQGLRGGRGQGAGRDASFDRDDARYDSPGASGRGGRDSSYGFGTSSNTNDMQRGLQSGDTLGRARSQWNERESQYGAGYGHEYGREGDYGRMGGGMSGRPGGTRDDIDRDRDRDRNTGGNWFNAGGATGGTMDRNPGQGFGGFGYSNADERGDQYDRSARGGMSSGMSGGTASNTSRGSFAGRGPRNYQRSDERIRDDICERLTRHPEIDASEVDIDVREGVVTLSGQVDDKHTKRLAEDVAEEVMGVRDVRNELRTARGGFLGALFGRGDATSDRSTTDREVSRDTTRDTTRDTGMGASSSGTTGGSTTGRTSTTGTGGTMGDAAVEGTGRRGRTS